MYAALCSLGKILDPILWTFICTNLHLHMLVAIWKTFSLNVQMYRYSKYGVMTSYGWLSLIYWFKNIKIVKKKKKVVQTLWADTANIYLIGKIIVVLQSLLMINWCPSCVLKCMWIRIYKNNTVFIINWKWHNH